MNAVLELLRERRRTASHPAGRADARVLALVIEGGAMRGLVSASMAAVLQEADLLAAFDLVVGTSSGGFNAAAFVVGRAGQAEEAYLRHLNDRRFVDVRRLLVGRPVVVLDRVFEAARDLDVDFAGVVGSPTALHLTAYSLDGRRTIDQTGFADVQAVTMALRASCCIPAFAGPPVVADGERLVDGSVLDPIPFRVALQAGATDLLVFATRRDGQAHSRRGAVDRLVIDPRLRRLDGHLAALERERPERYDADIRALEELARSDGPARACLVRLREGDPPIGNLDTDAGGLRAVAEAARHRMHQALVDAGVVG